MLSQVNGADAQDRRTRSVRRIRRSSELEGASSTAASRADQDAYVAGAITADELGTRVRRRYGIQK
ncbi:antitoxin VbhA family protein [Gordonia defluvii]|uniref:antitoxin VbhA family protein n=1 Tax=Gordonia defluvii TaxID=283718 RepID=UPI003CD07763